MHGFQACHVTLPSFLVFGYFLNSLCHEIMQHANNGSTCHVHINYDKNGILFFNQILRMSLNPWFQHKKIDIPEFSVNSLTFLRRLATQIKGHRPSGHVIPKSGRTLLEVCTGPHLCSVKVDLLWCICPPWHLIQNICSRSRILTSSNSSWWCRDSIWMWWGTPDEVELGQRCSRNLMFHYFGVPRSVTSDLDCQSPEEGHRIHQKFEVH